MNVHLCPKSSLIINKKCRKKILGPNLGLFKIGFFGNQKIKTRHSTKGWESLTFSALSKKVQNLAEKSSPVLEF